MESFNSIKVTATRFSIFIHINRDLCCPDWCRSLILLIKLLIIHLRNRNMSKSLSFIILALLVVANTESRLILANHIGQGSTADASFSSNPTASPDIVDCSGITREECLIAKLKKALEDYIYHCPPGGCKWFW